eukprot:TCONS_00052108-protein
MKSKGQVSAKSGFRKCWFLNPQLKEAYWSFLGSMKFKYHKKKYHRTFIGVLRSQLITKLSRSLDNVENRSLKTDSGGFIKSIHITLKIDFVTTNKNISMITNNLTEMCKMVPISKYVNSV